MTRDNPARSLHPANGTSLSSLGSNAPLCGAVPGVSQWTRAQAANPGHSEWFIERWERMKREGKDLDGEARLVDALAVRDSLIFDAGSGTGRVGGALHDRGHRVVGLDLDPVLVRYADENFPGPTWIAGDLASSLDLVDPQLHGKFDIVVAAGNVVTFPAAGDRERIMASYSALLHQGGRFIAGFGTGRGYPLQEFLAHAKTAGFTEPQLFSTWDLRPISSDPEFVVALLTLGS